jgi:hypothetical protein
MKSMVTTQSQANISSFGSTPQFVSRIFTDLSGRQFRMTFLVAVVNGELKGQLVSVQPISVSHLQLTGETLNDLQTREGIVCLPIYCPKKKAETAYVPGFTPVISPYTELFFFTSQPTRAPSF